MMFPTAAEPLSPRGYIPPVAASLAPHPSHERIDINIPDYLDEVAPIIVLRPLAVAARCANPAPPLVQGRQGEDAVEIGGRYPNELGTNASCGQGGDVCTVRNNSRQAGLKGLVRPEGGSEPLGRVEGRSASIVCASALPSS
jgi:hypothetical protein